MTALLVAAAMFAPSPFVALEDVAPTIFPDMRCATRHNFVGRRVDGYREPICILTRRAALALRRAQRALAPEYGLKVYDCYRPQRAVDFASYANEWWHFTLRRERYPRRAFDFPVSRRALR
jgi:zinc D-Ala-D-Ala dipeptidase